MLQIEIQPKELWDEINEQFVTFEGQKLMLEHSLISISKWESKWHKPFISKNDKTSEETIDYIRCMNIMPNVDPDIYNYLTNEDIAKVDDYISNSMTATKVKDLKGDSGVREPVTSELIYYWMFSLNIPMECHKWHLNRLLTLIKIFNIKNAPVKKMGKRELMRRNAAINEERKKRLNTSG